MSAAPLTPSTERLRAYAVRLGSGHVLLASPQALLDVLRALQLSTAAGRRQMGLGTPPRVAHLLRLLALELDEHRRAAEHGNAEVPPEPVLPTSVEQQHIDVEEAASMLGLTPRQVRNLAPDLGARKVAGVWVLDRDAVAMAAAARHEESA